MTAWLGTLLFISQTRNQCSALLLFCLGFGMGIPLLIASVLGASSYLKRRLDAHQIKVIFAFLMLGLTFISSALYYQIGGCKLDFITWAKLFIIYTL